MNRPALKLVHDETRQQGLGAVVAAHLRNYFADHGAELPAAGLYARVVREVERPLIATALAVCDGNQLKTADLLGINRNTLRKKMRELGLDAARTKAAGRRDA